MRFLDITIYVLGSSVSKRFSAETINTQTAIFKSSQRIKQKINRKALEKQQYNTRYNNTKLTDKQQKYKIKQKEKHRKLNREATKTEKHQNVRKIIEMQQKNN